MERIFFQVSPCDRAGGKGENDDGSGMMSCLKVVENCSGKNERDNDI